MAGAQTAAGPKSAAEVNKTPADVVMTEDYIATIGREAYLWGWPLINHRHRRAAFSKVPTVDALHPRLVEAVALHDALQDADRLRRAVQ